MININIGCLTAVLIVVLSSKISSELSEPVKMRVMQIRKGDLPAREG